MIGLHVATKVENTPQWVWSTFEHKGNVPDLDSLPKQPPTASTTRTVRIAPRSISRRRVPGIRPNPASPPRSPRHSDRRSDHGAEQVVADGPGVGQPELALAVLRPCQHAVADAGVQRLQYPATGAARSAIPLRSFSPTPLWKATSRATRPTCRRVASAARRTPPRRPASSPTSPTCCRWRTPGGTAPAATPAPGPLQALTPSHQRHPAIPMPAFRPRSPVPWMKNSPRRPSSPCRRP